MTLYVRSHIDGRPQKCAMCHTFVIYDSEKKLTYCESGKCKRIPIEYTEEEFKKMRSWGTWWKEYTPII